MMLQEEFLWQQFNSLGNEMIITRSGRCLFPLFRISFESCSSNSSSMSSSIIFNCIDIKEDSFYRIGVMIEQLDWMKWRYREGQWQPILGGFNDMSKSITRPSIDHHHHHHNSNSNSNNNNSNDTNGNSFAVNGNGGSGSGGSLVIYEPFESSRKGKDLIESGVSFAKLKLVNRSSFTGGMGINSKDRKHRSVASLHSFHRYRPMIYIKQVIDKDGLIFNWNEAQRIFYPETQFIAVTHYQNEAITLLKKSYNPHAKGFVINNHQNQFETESSFERKRYKRRRVYPIQFISEGSSSLHENENEKKEERDTREEESTIKRKREKNIKGDREKKRERERDTKKEQLMTLLALTSTTAISEASEEEVIAGLALQKMSSTSTSSQPNTIITTTNTITDEHYIINSSIDQEEKEEK